MKSTSSKRVQIIHDTSSSATIPGTSKKVQDILNSTPTFTGPMARYKPARLLSNGQAHTLYMSLRFKKHAPISPYKSVSLVMADGGNTTVSLSPPSAFGDGGDRSNRPIVVVIHGISGSPREPYITPIVDRLTAPREAGGCGARVAVMTLRGCDGQRMTSPVIHHSGQTQDLSAVILWLTTMFPCSNRFGIGCSMGGTILTNYLGERGERSGLTGGLAVSSVSRLSACLDRLRNGNIVDRKIVNTGLGRLYGEIFSQNTEAFFSPYPWMNSLMEFPLPSPVGSSASSLSGDHGSLRSNATSYSTPASSLASGYSERVAQAASVIATDLRSLTMSKFSSFVGVCAGFDSTEEFCSKTSSEHGIPGIRTPFMMLNAMDDPMMPGEALPTEAVAGNPYVAMGVTKHGGHLGWIGRRRDSQGRRVQWHVDGIVEWINGLIDVGAKSRASPCGARGPVGGMTYEAGHLDVGYMEASRDFINMIPLKTILPRRSS